MQGSVEGGERLLVWVLSLSDIDSCTVFAL